MKGEGQESEEGGKVEEEVQESEEGEKVEGRTRG